MNTQTVETKAELIARYAEALKQGKTAALAASQAIRDGGTCNMDSVTIDLKGWKLKEVQLLASLSGIGIGDKVTSGIWKGHYFIDYPVHGQGDNRTRMMIAAQQTLKELNVPAYMFYQMD